MTVDELIAVLQELPKDLPIQVEAEGLFAVSGAHEGYSEDGKCIQLDLELINW